MMLKVLGWILSLIVYLFSFTGDFTDGTNEVIFEDGTIVGTWYMEEDEAVVLIMEEDGRVLYYDYDYDTTQIGSWSGSDGSYTMNIGWSAPYELTAYDENTLVSYDFTLVKGADAEVPFITYNSLYNEAWYTEDGFELCFYSDGYWDISDPDFNVLLEGGENSVSIMDNEITLITLADEELTLYVSADGKEIYCSDNQMTFIMNDPFAIEDSIYEEIEESESRLSGTWIWSDDVNSGSFTFTPDWVEFEYVTENNVGCGTGFYTETSDGVLLNELSIDEFGDGEFSFQDENTLVANNGVILTREE